VGIGLFVKRGYPNLGLEGVLGGMGIRGGFVCTLKRWKEPLDVKTGGLWTQPPVEKGVIRKDGGKINVQ